MVRETPSWDHTLKTVLQSNLKAVFLFFMLITVSNRVLKKPL